MHHDLSSLSQFRARAHAAHSEQLETLLALAQKKDKRDPEKVIQQLETALLAHLRAEDELLLPDFGLAHAHEAAGIRGQHERIRQLFARVNETRDASTRAHALDQLGALLRDCAALEEDLLYPWAERELRASKKGEFLQRSDPPAPFVASHRQA